MEAKDTVMSEEQVKALLFSQRCLESIMIAVEAQAEISFRQGRLLGCAEGIDVGRLEVVECIKEIDRADKKLPVFDVDGVDYTVLLCENWQAKLKEWGIK